jgi:hypothetical protein
LGTNVVAPALAAANVSALSSAAQLSSNASRKIRTTM